jgi:hypothetical protein
MIDEYTIKPNRIPTPRSSFDSPDVCFLHGKHPEFTSQPNAGYQLAVLTATLIRLPSSIFPVLVNFPTGSLEMFTEWRLRKVGAEGSSVEDPELEGLHRRDHSNIFSSDIAIVM